MKAAAPKKDAWDDLFPSDGLVRQYRARILKEVREYSRRYRLPFREVLPQALIIAAAVEKKFDPKRGLDFSTPLLWELKRLNRVCGRRFRQKYGLTAHRPKLEAYEVENNKRAAKRAYDKVRDVTWSDGMNYSKWKEKAGGRVPTKLVKAAERLRPRLKNERQRAVLDWMIGDLTGRETRSMKRAAADIGLTASYASKIVYGIARDIKNW